MSDDENKDQHYIMRSNSLEEGENENEKPQAPVRPRLKWGEQNDRITVASDKKEQRNGEKSPNQSHPIFLVENQEDAGNVSSDNLAAILGASIGKKHREELLVKPEEKIDFEDLLQAEREKLTFMFQNEMQERLTELGEQLNDQWSKKYDEIQKSYENRIDQYEHLLKAAETKDTNDEGSHGQAEFISRLEKEISEKYQQQYLDKIEEIQQNFKSIEEENLAQIIEEIRKELEEQYEQKFNDQVVTLREEARREIERNSEALGRTREVANNEFERMLEGDIKTSIEATMREKFEKEREAMIKKYSQEQASLKKEITSMENKIKEKLEVEIKEELDKEYSRKEKLANLNWRKKMDNYKKTLEENLEHEMKAKLDNERKELEKSKVEINRIKSLENVRLKKAEDSKKAVEQKLKDQEEKYEKMIANLKKQIDDFKREPQHSEAESFSQPLKKLDSTRTARNTSQTKINRQPTIPAAEERSVEMNARSRREMLGESPFFTRNQGHASRSRSPVQDNFGQRQSYMSQGELYDERDGDKSTYSRGVYNQPASTLRNRPNNYITEEPNKVIMNILDPMAPPDLLSQENVQVLEMPLRERESVREERKLPLIQQSEGVSNYDSLKAEIMKKYSPIKRNEEIEENYGGKQGAFYNMSQVSSKMLGSGLVDDFQTLDLSTTAKGTGFLASQQSIGQNKDQGKDETFAKKYEALLQKYNKEGFMKEQYKSLLSKKESSSTYRDAAPQLSFKENVQDQDQGDDKYHPLFEIEQKDDAKVKEMKKLKKSIETAIKKDNALESKYIEKEMYFISDFLIKTNVETTGQQKTLKNAFKTLFDLWNNIETSYQARINFVDNLELIPEYENLMEKITLEIDYLTVTQKNVGEIMGFIKKRNYYREQINFEGFEYRKYRKLYFAIDGNNIDMRKLLEQYRRKYNKDVLYKGIEVNEIIKVDAWEHEYLQKTELKGEILEKIRRKI